MSTELGEFATLKTLAAHLGLPAAWLRAEAEAGRLPSLQTSPGRVYFDVSAVRRSLQNRMVKTHDAQQ